VVRDFRGPVDLPLHDTIQRSIRRRIEAGEFGEGARLPSEADLQLQFHASRTPVRQALRRLQSEGLIVRAQGRGSFVASAKIGLALRDVISFTDDLRRLGHRVVSRTLELERRLAPVDVTRELGSEDGQTTFMRRLIVVDEAPLALFDHWLTPRLPYSALVAAGDVPSLYALLNRHGLEPWYGSESIGAVNADADTARILECDPGAALLSMRRVARDLERLPVEHTTYLVRADRYEYHVNLVRQRR
jgi:GntR family transcriptional regulator